METGRQWLMLSCSFAVSFTPGFTPAAEWTFWRAAKTHRHSTISEQRWCDTLISCSNAQQLTYGIFHCSPLKLLAETTTWEVDWSLLNCKKKYCENLSGKKKWNGAKFYFDVSVVQSGNRDQTIWSEDVGFSLIMDYFFSLLDCKICCSPALLKLLWPISSAVYRCRHGRRVSQPANARRRFGARRKSHCPDSPLFPYARLQCSRRRLQSRVQQVWPENSMGSKVRRRKKVARSHDASTAPED